MSLTAAMSSALSGILASQDQLDVVSRNIANANTPGYTAKTKTPESRVVAGTGTGVQLTNLSRTVDTGVQRDLNNATSTTSKLSVMQSMFQQFEATSGNQQDNTSISAQISQLGVALQTLITTPEQPTNGSNVVNAAQNAASSIRNLYQSAVNIQNQAVTQMQGDINTVNNDLSQVAQLNSLIATNTAEGRETADLEDQRDQYVSDIAKYMQVSTYKASDNTMSIYSQDGKVLANNQAFPLTLDTTGGKPSITQTINGQTQTLSVTNGEIGGLMDMNTNQMETVKKQLDDIARAVSENIQNASVSAGGGQNRFVTLFTVNGASYTGTGQPPSTPTDPTGQTPYNIQTAMNNTPPSYYGYAAVIGVNQAVVNNPTTLRDGTNSQTAGVAGGPAALAPGDTTLMSTVQATFQSTSISFTSSTGLPATGSYTGVAADLVTGQSTAQANVNSQYSYYSTLQQTLQTKNDNISGVNMDSEMSQMLVLQNSYVASSKVFTTVNQMYQALMNLVQ